MKCSQCGTTVQKGDRFCEECGASLVAEISPPKTGKCEKCGANSKEIDPEGYCSICGFRNQIQLKDYLEINLQPNLAGITDRGLRHHRNEDYLSCAKVAGKPAYVLVICDGVSSSQTPEIAAKAAADSACKSLTLAIEKGKMSAEEMMKLAIQEALASVCAIPHSQSEDLEPPSTTIVAAIVQDNTATIGWLGDSRAYWISDQSSRQLTTDHSWFNDIVLSGKMTVLEARQSPQYHAITKWLGSDAIDDSEPSIVNFEIPGAGYLLLCTDGLWNYASEAEQIVEMVQRMKNKDAVTISRYLVDFAKKSGGSDNITVAIMSF